MSPSRRALASLTGRGSPLRDPWTLGIIAVLLACAIAMQAAALLSRPALPAAALQVDALGQQGTVDRGRLSNAVCAIDLGVDMDEITRRRSSVMGELRRFADALEIEPPALHSLLGLGEALLVRYDFARLYYDMALLPPETTLWQLRRERERGLAATSLLLPPDQARSFEAELFQAWDRSWTALEDSLSAPADGSRPPRLTTLGSSEPTP